MFRTCIEKGKTYNARFDVSDPSVETGFEFIGEGAAENRFTRDWWNGFGIPYIFLQHCGPVSGFKAYRSYIDAEAGEFIARLDSIGNPGMKEFYLGEIRKKTSSYLFYYPYVAMNAGVDPFTDKEFEAYIAGDVCSSMTEEEFAEFFNGVASMVASVYSGLDLLKVVKAGERTTLDPARNNFAMTSLMLAFISAAANNNLEAAYSYYKSVCKEKGYTDQVDGLYRSAVVLVKGAEAPEIEFTDADGRIYTLADFKGKALYVDMWASWCGPCCAEIPHLAKLYKDLGPGSGIECISISIDEDRNDWLGKLDEEKPEWKQFIVTEKGQKQVANSYNIRSIPRFLLFDAQGRIVTVDAPRPSTPDVRKLLDELLTD